VRWFGLNPIREWPPLVGLPAESPIRLQEQLPATVESVSEARGAIRRFARELEVDLDGMVLAVSEAVANVVLHAYDDPSGAIELVATASPSEVTVIVRDRGRGLAAESGIVGAGFGIDIIRRLAQQVTLEDGDPGVALTMRFVRGGPWAAR
jgi:anti-sigma regulatory factor (Ser/Thr protein kinase)